MANVRPAGTKTNRRPPRATAGSRTRTKRGEAASQIRAWEDDPLSRSDVLPVDRPVPSLSSTPLALSIKDPAPPAGQYAVGTPEFRYWTAAEASRRAADFWGALIGTSVWEVGKVLPIHLDEGEDLNAFYTRGGGGDEAGLSFFHADVLDGRGTTAVAGAATRVFSAESPDVVCHETGHAVLDSIRPELFNATNFETSAFHEAFGDITAILSAIQLETVRDWITREGARSLYRSSRLSRLAEQLGWAIRKTVPQAVEPDCLRNAVNSFQYQDPRTLPDDAPASALSREPHSFSRVFTGAFYAALSEMCTVLDDKLTADALAMAANDAGRLLVAAIDQAPIVPQYFSEIAAHMVEADTGGKYISALTSTFKKRGLMSLMATARAAKPPSGAAASAETTRKSRKRGLARIALSGAELGLGDAHILVDTASDPPSMSMFGVATRATTGSAAADTRLFVQDLFKHGRVESPAKKGTRGPGRANVAAFRSNPLVVRTHILVREGGDLVLRRRLFD